MRRTLTHQQSWRITTGGMEESLSHFSHFDLFNFWRSALFRHFWFQGHFNKSKATYFGNVGHLPKLGHYMAIGKLWDSTWEKKLLIRSRRAVSGFSCQKKTPSSAAKPVLLCGHRILFSELVGKFWVFAISCFYFPFSHFPCFQFHRIGLYVVHRPASLPEGVSDMKVTTITTEGMKREKESVGRKAEIVKLHGGPLSRLSLLLYLSRWMKQMMRSWKGCRKVNSCSRGSQRKQRNK